MKKQRTKTKATLAALLVMGLIAATTMTIQPFVHSAAAQKPAPAVDAAALQRHVQYLSMEVAPRSADFPEHLNAAADYILRDLTAAGVIVQTQEYDAQGVTYRNLVARFGPTEGKVLVMGAHYDSHGSAMHHTPGADDNASGTAGLMELAKLLSQHPPSRPVELVFYTLEEPPHFRTEFMGSAVHAHALLESKRPVDMMLAVEMIGYFTDAPNSQTFPLSVMKWMYPSQGDFIAVVGRYKDMMATRRVKAALQAAEGLPAYSINAPTWVTGVDFSDHLNYWAQGFSAVMVTDTSFYRNREYHLDGDTYDRLDYPRMAQVVQGLFHLAHPLTFGLSQPTKASTSER